MAIEQGRAGYLNLSPLGDSALLVQLGTTIDPVTHARAIGFAEALKAIPGVEDALTSYASVTVYYDSDRIGLRQLTKAVRSFGTDLGSGRSRRRTVEIPVVYDGPDLREVAEKLRLSVADVIRIHSQPTYQVFLIGFSPGLPYLGPLPIQLQLPRRAVPRVRVPAGSVAIAAQQTTIYTFPTPGGWHLLGHTPLDLFIPEADPPALLQAGDRVRFVPSTN